MKRPGAVYPPSRCPPAYQEEVSLLLSVWKAGDFNGYFEAGKHVYNLYTLIMI